MATNKHKGTCIIEFGGKKRGLVFNMNTYAIFCEGMDIELMDIDKPFQDKRQAKSFCWLLYSAIIAYDEKHNLPIDYNIHDVYDWVMDVTESDTKLAMNTMLYSRELKNESNNGISRNVVDTNKDDVKKN
jgi:hypothetical protein